MSNPRRNIFTDKINNILTSNKDIVPKLLAVRAKNHEDN